MPPRIPVTRYAPTGIDHAPEHWTYLAIKPNGDAFWLRYIYSAGKPDSWLFEQIKEPMVDTTRLTMAEALRIGDKLEKFLNRQQPRKKK